MSANLSRSNNGNNTPMFGSLFSGIGGLDLGLERSGMSCRWQVEINDYARTILKQHWPTVKRYGDIRTINAGGLERVDCLAGGFPCQDISNAGNREGIDGARSGLWVEYLRIVHALRPRVVLVENVAALLLRGIDRVLGALAEIGYDAEWRVLDSQFFGVPQRRRRVFIVAYPGGSCSASILHSDAPILRAIKRGWMQLASEKPTLTTCIIHRTPCPYIETARGPRYLTIGEAEMVGGFPIGWVVTKESVTPSPQTLQSLLEEELSNFF